MLYMKIEIVLVNFVDLVVVWENVGEVKFVVSEI